MSKKKQEKLQLVLNYFDDLLREIEEMLPDNEHDDILQLTPQELVEKAIKERKEAL